MTEQDHNEAASAPNRRKLLGRAASSGLGIGAVVRTDSGDRRAPARPVRSEEGEHELRLARRALDGAREGLTTLRSDVTGEGRDIIEAQLGMLADPELTGDITKHAPEISAAGAIDQALQERISAVAGVASQRIAERATDLRDLRNRLLTQLGVGEATPDFSSLPAGSVVVATDLTPSETVGLNADAVSGLVLAAGGVTAHTAIVARARGIPAVVQLAEALEITPGSTLIVDSDTGEVIVNPTESELSEAQVKRKKHKVERVAAGSYSFATLADGSTIRLSANVGSAAEARRAAELGAGTVGLLRAELTFFAHEGGLPDEHAQYEDYRGVVEALNGGRVTIRLLDVGGDKPLPPLTEEDPNPQLGLRGVRLLLAHRDVLRTQLRAIARAAVAGPVWISVPMVSAPSEFAAIRQEFHDVCRELDTEHIERGDVKLGVMIETPAAAFLAPELASAADFFSVGTNDLAQYVIAADRDNPRVSALLDPLHPGLLRALRMIIAGAHRAGITVSICGEAAAAPGARRILIGLGVDELSMAAGSLATVAADLAQTDRVKLASLARRATEAANTADVRAMFEPPADGAEDETNPSSASDLIERLDDGGFTIATVISDPAGLHARPANQFVTLAQTFDAEITLEVNGRTANGKALLSLLALGADTGADVRLTAHGAQAREAVVALGAHLSKAA